MSNEKYKVFEDIAKIDEIFSYEFPEKSHQERYDKIYKAAKFFAKTVIEHCPDCENRSNLIKQILDITIRGASIEQ